MANRKIVINPKYNQWEPIINQIFTYEWFSQHGETIHNKRNTLKIIEIDGVRLAVKRFGHITLFNQMIYGTLRKSKALRAYEYAARLRNLGIDTPEEVAYTDIRRNGRLADSYFISLCSDYSPIGEALKTDAQLIEFQDLVIALTHFLHRIHQKGVIHKDLHPSNILYSKGEDGQYKFQLIDINQMAFHRSVSTRQRLKNMIKLSVNVPLYMAVLEYYARIEEVPSQTFHMRGFLVMLPTTIRRTLKHTLKRWFRIKPKRDYVSSG